MKEMAVLRVRSPKYNEYMPENVVSASPTCAVSRMLTAGLVGLKMGGNYLLA